MNEVLERHGLTVTIIETPSLGDRSYVVDDGSSALVIDPQRDIDRVTQVLAKQGVQLAAVAETHAHNDYVSGGLELARAASVPSWSRARPRRSMRGHRSAARTSCTWTA
jgi:hydroxyacylglutathione hydrolase